MIALFKANLLWTEGISVCGVLLLISIIGFLWSRWLLYGALILSILSFYFFRNPDRICREALEDDRIVICPADGKVVDIEYDTHARFEGYTQKISIFLSPLDVHVNWIPTSGMVEKAHYFPGKYTVAFLPKASALNEHNDIHIKSKYGTVLVRQIAGMLARRISCWVHSGNRVRAGNKYGMIRFGSRVDMLMPHEIVLSVGIGQQVYGGETILGRWSEHE